MEKKLFKTVITIEILSEQPIPEEFTMKDIVNEYYDGAYSGISDIADPIEIVGDDAIKAECDKHDTDVEFFGFNNEIDEDALIVLEHFENGLKHFYDEAKFLSFVSTIFEENEDWMNITRPKNLAEAKNYIKEYCDNFTIVKE